MLTRDKIPALFALGAAVIAILLAAASLSNLEFAPAKPFSLAAPTVEDAVYADLPGGEWVITVLRVLLITGWILLPFILIYLLLTKEGRRIFLRELMIWSIIIGLLYLFQRLRQLLASPLEQESQPLEPAVPQMPTPPPEIAFHADPPRWVVLAVSLLISVVFLLLILLAVRYLRRRLQPKKEFLASISRQAGSALQALYDGEDINHVILRCYRQMTQELAKQRGLERRQAMTAQEFVGYLTQRGLPEKPLQSLTRLFEKVRYGAIPAGERDRLEAIDSLNAILEACKGYG